jgi:hypothetical protein
MMDLQQSQRETEFRHDILSPFILGNQANATNQHDKVYGLLGLLGRASTLDIKPNYHLTASEVFTDFAKTVIAAGMLDILRLANSPIGSVDRRKPAQSKPTQVMIRAGCRHSAATPSWAPCWSCPLGSMTPWSASYSVSPPAAPPFPRFPSANTLVVRAAVLDSVAGLTAFAALESDPAFPHSGAATAATTTSFYGSAAATADALWRTLVGDVAPSPSPHPLPSASSSTTHPAPASWSLLLGTSLVTHRWSHVTFALRDCRWAYNFRLRNRAFPIYGLPLGQWMRPARDPGPDRETERRLLDATRQMAACMAAKRLCTTQRGRLGTVPPVARSGDALVVVPGCAMPLVLRRMCAAEGEDGDEGEAKWRVLGEAYVHGIMRGEVASWLEEGKCQLQDVVLM